MVDRHEYTMCPTKHQTRLDTFALVRQCPLLWNRSRYRLARSWMTLTGIGDPTLDMLLQAQALQPPQVFFGINGPPPDETVERGQKTAQAILTANEAAFPYPTRIGVAKWVYGRMEHLLLNPDPFADVGVLEVDGFYTFGSRDLTALHEPMFTFALDQARRIGQFVLTLNIQRRGSPSCSVQQGEALWKEGLKQLVGRSIPDQAFYTYTSRGSGWPMTVCRVVLTPRPR